MVMIIPSYWYLQSTQPLLVYIWEGCMIYSFKSLAHILMQYFLIRGSFQKGRMGGLVHSYICREFQSIWMRWGCSFSLIQHGACIHFSSGIVRFWLLNKVNLYYDETFKFFIHLIWIISSSLACLMRVTT